MGLLEVFAISITVAAFETVVGTLVAILLAAVLFDTPFNIYDAVFFAVVGSIIVSVLYQFFDPTFLHIIEYLETPLEQRSSIFYATIIFPIARYAIVHLLVDIGLAAYVYRVHYRKTNESLFPPLYSLSRTTLTLSIWILFIVPAFAQVF